MADEPDVGIGVGAVYDEAATEKAMAEFEAGVQKAIAELQNRMQLNLQFGQFEGLEKLRDALKETPGFNAKAVEEAYKRMKEEAKQATQQVAQATTQMGQATSDTSTKTQAAMQNMGASVDAYRAKVDAMKEAILAYQQQSGASFADIKAAVAPQIAPADRKAFTQGLKEAEQQLKATGQEKDKFKQNVSGLGSVAQFVFGTIFGITVYSMLRKVINIMKEAVVAGEEYLTALFRLSVAVRALQRSGLDITLQDVNKTISELAQKFPQFSEVALTQGMANALLFTANLKLTKEQIAQMITASTTLAAVMGRDVNEVMRTLALTMSSGYSEGLQRLGININKIIITEKAHAMGVKEGYNAMTQQQRAVAALAVVYEQTAKMQEDATKYAETAPGRMATATAKFQNALKDLGTFFAPTWSKIIDFIATGVERAIKLFSTLFRVILDFAGQNGPLGILARLGAAASALFDTLSGKGSYTELYTIKREAALKQIQYEIDTLYNPAKVTALGNEPIGAGSAAEEEQQKLIEITEAMQEGLVDIVRDGIRDRLKLETDLARDLEEIDKNLKRDLEESERDHLRNLENIDLKEARDRADAYTDYTRQIHDDVTKENQDIADANAKHRADEIKAEEDYQRKIRQMQQNYLLELEDAIRARDAKTAFQLLRRFKLQYAQAKEDYSAERKQRDIEFQRELEQLAQQRVRRAKERQLDYQRKLEDINLQAAQERSDEEVRYTQQRADLLERAVQEREDRRLQYQQQLEDLQVAINDQLKKLADGLIKQYSLTTDFLSKVYDAYMKIYGPNGGIERLYQYMLGSAASYMNQMSGDIGSFFSQMFGNSSQAGITGGHSEGGTYLATRPVTATFGERGPEIVSVTPLGYVGRNTGKFLGTYGGGMGGSENLIKLEVLLSRDLEGRIVLAAVDEMSNLMVSVEREK